MKRFISVLFMIVLIIGAVSAQNRGALQIQCNQSGAQVFIANKLMGTTNPNFATLLPAGTYAVKVAKAGFEEFNATINHQSSGTILQVNLLPKGSVAPAPAPAPAPSLFPLQVLANQPNSEVLINGQSKGRAPITVQVPAGQYTVIVRAPNMIEFRQVVDVNGPVTVNANAMAPQPQQLTVSSNVQGAEVLINKNPAGKTPFSATVAPGSYAVTVRAPGFVEFNQNVVVSGPVQVNATLQPLSFALTVSANVQGAGVFINGNQAGKTPFSATVAPGSYSVSVRAPGFVDFNQNVVVNGPVQVNATLQQVTFALTVSANVPGADVYLNNNLAGKAPFSAQLPAGSYAVTVRAAGYVDFNQNVVVSGPAQVNAALQPLTYQLTVDAVNFKGAQVLINGNPAGQTPFAAMLPPATYGVTIKAPGFTDFAASVALNGPQQVQATLQPAPASWQVVVPDAAANKDLKGGHWSQIQVYVDGVLQKASSAQVTPGRHVLRIVSGGLAVESPVDFQPGKAYTFEASLGFTVK